MEDSYPHRSIDPIHQKWMRSINRIPFKSGDKVVVAVSGGCDSVCLLYLLKRQALNLSLSLHVAHLNHGFRPEAKAEADFVEGLVRSWGIPLTSSRRPVMQICRDRGLSKQEGARTVRYQFLKEVARELGASWIALGHTADDQAETFLMRLLRGTGMRGLKGIPEMREARGEGLEETRIIRPLLGITREEILRELNKEKISYVEDSSNLQSVYLRNQIRHALFPVLEQYNPRVKEAFCREADLLREEDDFIEHALRETVSRVVKTNESSVIIDLKPFQALHLALQRRVLRWGIERLHPGLRGIGFHHIETIMKRVVPGQTGKYFFLPHSVRVKKEYSHLHLERMTFPVARREKSKKRFKGSRGLLLRKEAALPEVLSCGDKTTLELADWGLRVQVSVYRGAHHLFSSCIASFDFDKLCYPLSIRGWKPGDRFIPKGMKGHHKKLQDFFVDIKIGRSERDRRPLLVCANGILWVIGLRTDERFQPSDQTKRTLVVEVQENDQKVARAFFEESG
ncbi:MAG: tRNA lysidine(34) synthetase TilS [Nitrospira sp.]